MLGTDRRFRSGGRAPSNCSLSSCTVASSKHVGRTAKPSCSTSSLNRLSLLVSFRFNVVHLGRILCPIGGGSETWLNQELSQVLEQIKGYENQCCKQKRVPRH